MALSFGNSQGSRIDNAFVNITNKLGMSFWYNSTASGSTKVIFELTTSWYNTAGSFILFANNWSTNAFDFNYNGSGGWNGVTFTLGAGTLNDGNWHHWAFNIDRTQTGSSAFDVWVDGSPVSLTQSFSNSNSANFADTNLHINARNLSAISAAGKYSDMAMYKSLLDQDMVDSLAAGASPLKVGAANLEYYMPMTKGTANQEIVTGTDTLYSNYTEIEDRPAIILPRSLFTGNVGTGAAAPTYLDMTAAAAITATMTVVSSSNFQDMTAAAAIDATVTATASMNIDYMSASPAVTGTMAVTSSKTIGMTATAAITSTMTIDSSMLMTATADINATMTVTGDVPIEPMSATLAITATVGVVYSTSVTGLGTFRLVRKDTGALLDTLAIGSSPLEFDLSTYSLGQGEWTLQLFARDAYGNDSCVTEIDYTNDSSNHESSLVDPSQLHAWAEAGGVIGIEWTAIQATAQGTQEMPAEYEIAEAGDLGTILQTVTAVSGRGRYTDSQGTWSDGVGVTLAIRSSDGASDQGEWVYFPTVVADAAGPDAPALVTSTSDPSCACESGP